VDGLDGAGKSTQCRLLAQWFRGRGLDVIECADPGSTAVGDLVRDLLLDHRREMVLACEAFLFMASRAQLTAEVIRPALDRGQAVVADRFLLANVVYQGHAGGMPAEKLWDIGLLATGGLEPDLTIVLDLPVDEARARLSGAPDRVERRQMDYHRLVREGFLAEARRRREQIRVIDAARPIDAVQDEIRAAVSGILGSLTKSR
jgi:dTMP kinase